MATALPQCLLPIIFRSRRSCWWVIRNYKVGRATGLTLSRHPSFISSSHCIIFDGERQLPFSQPKQILICFSSVSTIFFAENECREASEDGRDRPNGRQGNSEKVSTGKWIGCLPHVCGTHTNRYSVCKGEGGVRESLSPG